MTNKARQKSLDRQKWFESEKNGYDMGGCMLYCQFCYKADHSDPTLNGSCYASQTEREDLSLCAIAYNRMVRKK